jgi:TolA-binding protein
MNLILAGKVVHVNISFRRAMRTACAVMILFMLGGGTVRAATEVEREFEFASGLVDMRFADLANRVVNRLVREHPDQEEAAKRIQGEILVQQQKFDEAEALLDSMPAREIQTYALHLKIANGYFRVGNTDKASELYKSFFDAFGGEPPKEGELGRFYQEAAYTYAQMMERMGRRAEAADAYRRLLDAGLSDPDVKRKLQYDLALSYLQLGRDASGDQKNTYLDQAMQLSKDLQWGGYDLWFGQSIPIMAHVEMERGRDDEARALLRDYREDLDQIEKALLAEDVPLAVSPLAGARFLLGELYEKQYQEMKSANQPETELVQKLGQALTEFYNVFAKYGESEWGPQAGMRGRAIIDTLEKEYGRNVNIDMNPEQVRTAVLAQYRTADDLFRQKKYEEAIPEYLLILNVYPEVEPSIRALANVALAYAHIEDTLSVRMLTDYLAERFGGQTIPGNALLALGKFYVEREDEDMYSAIFDRFLEAFPEHDRAPALMFDMARMREAAGDIEASERYYRTLLEKYPEDRFALRAMYALAINAYESKDFDAAAPLFASYVKESRPGADRIRAQFLMGDALQQQDKFREAIQAFGQIISWLNRDNAPDNARAEDAAQNADFLEKSLFFVGYCFGRMSEPESQVPAFRKRAITAYEQFLSRYENSPLAPKALRDKGAMQLALGESAEAAETFDELASRYPDSEEGKSALFALVSSALDIGENQIARDAFNRMMETPDAYSPEEFTRIGQLLLNAGLYEDVIPAYRAVVDNTEDRRMLEMALFGLGTAYSRQGAHEEAAKSLADLLERFPKSGYFYDAQYLLARSLRLAGRPSEAIAPLSNILRFSRDNVRNQRAQFELALTQVATDDKQVALGSFQRISLLQDPRDPRNEPILDIIEESLIEAARLAMELELYNEVEDTAEQYVNDFPRGQYLEEIRDLRSTARLRAETASVQE